MTVTLRVYDQWRRACRPKPPLAGTLRKRQLSALVDAYGVHDHRPAAGDAEGISVVAGHPAIVGEALWIVAP